MSTETLTVGLFKSEDAEGVAGLFNEIYGGGYPAKIVYQPDKLIEAFKRRENIPQLVKKDWKSL